MGDNKDEPRRDTNIEEALTRARETIQRNREFLRRVKRILPWFTYTDQESPAEDDNVSPPK